MITKLKSKMCMALTLSIVIGMSSFTANTYAAEVTTDPVPEVVQETSLEGTPETVQENMPTELTQYKAQDLVEQFVERFYRYLLGRDADSTGLNEWVQNLKSGKEQGAQVGVGFIQSNEFKNRGLSDDEYIQVLYRAFFDRDADPAGLESWKKVLNEGLTRMQVYRGFAESDEFSRLCASYGIQRGNVTMSAPMDQNEGVTKFISRCYSLCLGRRADESGLNAWCGQILSGANTAKVAAYGFVFSNEFTSKNLSDEEYIKVLYRLFLNREADTSGLQSWKQVMVSGKGRLHVFEGFSDSKEFKELCDSYGIASGQGTPILSINTAYREKMLDIYNHPLNYFEPMNKNEPEIESNTFAIADVTGDGKDDLIVSFNNTFTAAMHTKIYSYNEAQNSAEELAIVSVLCDFYTGGLITSYANHNQSPGDLWPGSVVKFNGQSFEKIASFWNWNIDYQKTDFPYYADKDGDGVVYYFGLEDTPIDKAAYEAKKAAVYDGHTQLSMNWQSITPENINNIR